MKQLAILLFSFLTTGLWAQSSELDNSLEFQLNGASATDANYGLEIRYSHRLNHHIKLWNWEYCAGLGLWSGNEQAGMDGMAAVRCVFGRRNNQVVGELGGAVLLNTLQNQLELGYTPVLNLGYRFTSKMDDWHLQATAGTWGIVSVNLGLKW